MKLTRLYVLLVLWLLCVTAPALIVLAGAFGHVDAATGLSGGIAGLWIGGYLVQFAVFMWISRVVDRNLIGSWFIASMLPFAFDWTVPVSPLFLIPWLGVGIATALFIAIGERRAQGLRERGIRARGVVLEVYKPMMNVVINNVYIKRKVRLRIERGDGTPPYEGTYNGTFMLGEIPNPGDSIPLIVDPQNPQHFDYDSSGADIPASSASSTAHSRGGDDLAGSLSELADLHDRGAINDDEFAAAKKKLLDPRP